MKMQVYNFKGLTDYTGNPNLLSYNGNNLFQDHLTPTPYSADLVLTFTPTLTGTGNHWIYLNYAALLNTGQAPSKPVQSGLTYIPKYKIYNISYNVSSDNIKLILDEHLNLEGYPQGIQLISLKKNTNFVNSQKEEKLPFEFDYDEEYPGDGTKFSELTFGGLPHVDILSPPLTNVTGYIKFSIKYYDKYLYNNQND